MNTCRTCLNWERDPSRKDKGNCHSHKTRKRLQKALAKATGAPIGDEPVENTTLLINGGCSGCAEWEGDPHNLRGMRGWWELDRMLAEGQRLLEEIDDDL